MRRLAAALACAAALSWSASARADDVPPARPGYTLKQCLELADHNHPNIAIAQAKLAYYRAQIDEARTAPFSAFSLTGGAGPAPTFRGGPVYTQDREVGLSSSLGMAWRFTVDGTVPIWTFGKITNTWRAADAQAQLGEEDIKRARNAVRTDVRRAYFGLQMSRDTKALIIEATERLDKALERAKKRVKEDDGDELDVLRLDTARADLEGRLAEAEKGERVALAALRFYTGVEGAFDIPDAPLRPPKHQLSDLPRYVDYARSKRPELNMARAGVRAREAQVDLARSKRLPDLGLYLFWSYARAPEITDQTNPFVRDDINYSRYGFALGLKWNLDFLPATARVRQAEAQLQETRAMLRFASSGVSADVERAFREAEEAKKKVDAYQRATRSAKQWMVKISQGIDVGVREEAELVDPARQYALARFNYLSALMNLNLAMASLAEKTGWDDVAEPAEGQ